MDDVTLQRRDLKKQCTSNQILSSFTPLRLIQQFVALFYIWNLCASKPTNGWTMCKSLRVNMFVKMKMHHVWNGKDIISFLLIRHPSSRHIPSLRRGTNGWLNQAFRSSRVIPVQTSVADILKLWWLASMFLLILKPCLWDLWLLLKHAWPNTQLTAQSSVCSRRCSRRIESVSSKLTWYQTTLGLRRHHRRWQNEATGHTGQSPCPTRPQRCRASL